MNGSYVHFVIIEGGSVRPLCGHWDNSPNWTKERAVVSCPACMARLAERGREGTSGQS
jgi:hypothetical protein